MKSFAAFLFLGLTLGSSIGNLNDGRVLAPNQVRKGPSLIPPNLKSGSSRVQCGKGGLKKMSDPEDSGKFYMCSFSGAHGIWIMYSFNCPKGTRFDQSAQKCHSGFKPQGSGGPNFQKLLSDRVLAKITAMMNANKTASSGNVGNKGNMNNNSNLKTEVHVAPATRPFVTQAVGEGAPSSTSQSHLNAMWSNHIKNYLQWQKQGGTVATTFSRYPKLPGYPYFTVTSTTTASPTTTKETTTTATPYLPPHRGVSKQVKAMHRIKSLATKMATMAEEVHGLVSCLEADDNCEDDSSSASDESVASAIQKDAVYFRPDVDEESVEDTVSSEDEPVVVHELSTSTTTTAAPVTTPMTSAVKNVFLKRPTDVPSNVPVESAEPKSSHEVHAPTLDLEKVVEDLLKDQVLAEAQASTYNDPRPQHGHTLFEDDDSKQEEDLRSM